MQNFQAKRMSALVLGLSFLALTASEQAFAKGGGGGWRIGPTFKLAFPHPVNGTLEILPPGRLFSFALGGGGLSLSQTAPAAVTVGMNNYEGRVRWHPFRGSFIIGSAVGYQNLNGSGAQSVSIIEPNSAQTFSVSAAAAVKISSMYVTPHMGWLWAWDSGFTLGFELGWYMPLSAKTTVTTTVSGTGADITGVADLVKATDAYKDMESQITDAGNKLGSLALPSVTVFRIGWLF